MSRSREAFPEYVLARRGQLRRLAYALCGDWHQADDIVQVALTKLYVAWPQIHRSGSEDAYARRVVANAVVDESRRPWRRRELTADLTLQESAEHFGTAGHGEQPAALPSDVVEALQMLPLMQRRVVLLRHWLDMSVSEVAIELGISEGTVKSHTSRAMARLHQLLTRPVKEETVDERSR